jgi:MOSC domain-containing protein YiiM
MEMIVFMMVMRVPVFLVRSTNIFKNEVKGGNVALKGKIVALQAGKPKEERFLGFSYKSAINKEKIRIAEITSEGIKGDGIANTKHHGGPERAICFYPFEHYQMWEQQWGRKMKLPGFGENVTVMGMKEEDVYIGDIYQMGECVIQITQGRIPCATISYFNYEPGFLQKVMETSLTGYFARVIKAGTLKDRDEIILLERVQQQVSVLYGNEIYLHGKDGLDGLEMLLGIPELALDWQRKVAKRKEAYLR